MWYTVPRFVLQNLYLKLIFSFLPSGSKSWISSGPPAKDGHIGFYIKPGLNNINDAWIYIKYIFCLFLSWEFKFWKDCEILFQQ